MNKWICLNIDHSTHFLAKNEPNEAFTFYYIPSQKKVQKTGYILVTTLSSLFVQTNSNLLEKAGSIISF